ncbi:MAG: Fic family protein [Bacteriovoracia bacterium]
MPQNDLEKQLAKSRFERAIEIVEGLIEKGAFLNCSELARLNQILTGKKNVEPWRDEPTECVLPSGVKLRFHVLADPIKHTKQILNQAKEKAASAENLDEVVDAAAELYAQIVLTHPFKDANRRIAVVAADYLLKLYNITISAVGLHELGLGDLREEGQIELLKNTMKKAVKLGVKPIK